MSQPAPHPVTPTPAIGYARRYGVLVLLVLGLGAGIVADDLAAPDRNRAAALAARWLPFALAAILAAIPKTRSAVAAQLDRLRSPSPRTRRRLTIAITLAATLYLYLTATWQNRDLTAKEQDESMYLVQTQQLARGRLWMPQHPCADFFESFHVMVKPKYAGIYFPGTALAYTPSVWLGLPPWVFSLLIAGAGVGMLYRVAAELIDGLAGTLAALLLLAAVQFRHLSTMVMSHTLMLLLALLMTWAYLRWRRERRWGWAPICGAFAGWAAITRPVDAIAYAAPIALAVAWELRKGNWKGRLVTPLLALAAAVPFLTLQLILDHGITGNALKTPVTAYHETYWPQAKIGFGDKATAAARPPTDKPQFHQYYDDYILPAYRQHQRSSPAALLAKVRLPMIATVALPSLILLALVPLALLELRQAPGGRPLLLAIPLFLIGYATFVFFRRQYAAVILPPMIIAVLLGARAVESTFPRWRQGFAVLFTIALAALALAHLPELNPTARDQLNPTPILSAVEHEARHLDKKPAILLVRHTPGLPRHEPVYNNDVAWPDDAPVVRAHDRGPRNAELFRYYAALGQNRAVYLFDKATRKIQYLGTATDLAHR